MPLYGSLSTHKSRGAILAEIKETFRKWGVEVWDVPYDSKARPVQAVVWFNLNGERKELRCSRFYQHSTNLLAIALTIEGLRLASQRGILEQYRQFFKALPAGQSNSEAEDPYRILGIREDASPDVAEAAYRALSRTAHPDLVSGSEAEFKKLTQAITQIREKERA